METNRRMPTNSPLDKILGGGVELGAVTNFFGHPGVGKTNITLSTMLSVHSGKTIYIDTEGGFSIERLSQMDKNRTAIKNIILFEPKSWQEQIDVFQKLERLVESDEISLIIVDSIVSLYRIEINDDNFSEINSQLARQYSILSKIAREKSIPVVVTNQVYAISKEAVELTSKTIARYWSKALIEIQKTERPNQRVAILRKHRSLPEGEQVEFMITESGLEEPKFRLF